MKYFRYWSFIKLYRSTYFLANAFLMSCCYKQFMRTPFLSTPAESTPKSFPVNIRPTKSVPGEKNLDFQPTQCELVVWVTSRKILNCRCSQWTSEVLAFLRWYCSDSLWSLVSSVLKVIKAINSCYTMEGFMWIFLV